MNAQIHFLQALAFSYQGQQLDKDLQDSPEIWPNDSSALITQPSSEECDRLWSVQLAMNNVQHAKKKLLDMQRSRETWAIVKRKNSK